MRQDRPLVNSRRTLLRALPALTGLEALAAPGWSGPNRLVPADALVIDGLSFLYFEALDPRPPGEELFRAIADSGVTAINYTVSASTFEGTVRTIARWSAVAHSRPDRLVIARSVRDVEEARATGRMAVLFGFQDPAAIGRDLSRLSLFHDLGVRVVQLTENVQNEFGSGCMERHDGGLTMLGRDLVKRMNGLGLLVDVSHCGPRTTIDAIEASHRPVAITHANCAAIHDTPRAKSDEAIRALAARGGVMGVTFLNFFVGAKARNTVEDAVDHVDHVRRLVGIDHVGVGSDLPIGSFLEVYPDEAAFLQALGPYITATGATFIRWPATIEDLDGPRKIHAFAAALARRGYSDADRRKVLGLNFLRVLREAVG